MSAEGNGSASEERLQSIIENLSEGLVVSDLSGNLLHWNPAALRLHGFETSEEWCRALPEFIDIFELATLDGEIVPYAEWPMPRIFRGEVLRNYELRIKRIGADWVRYFSYGGGIVPQVDGSRVCILTIIDITDRTLATKELQKLNAELERRVEQRTSQLEAANRDLEAFSYSVSHDLRAPLRAVNGFSRILLDECGPDLPPEGRRKLEVILRSGERMGKLIEDLLAFSKLGRAPVKARPVNMGVLVKRVLDDLNEARQGPPADVRLGPLPQALGDGALLEQVWVNLLGNALKYTRGKDPAVIEIDFEESPEGGAYRVRDNGAGFDMKLVHKLFGVFQRLHRAEEFEGTGVGLAIVQRIVERHGGRIWARAEVGKGATFYFTLGRAMA